jgi:predicted helicase
MKSCSLPYYIASMNIEHAYYEITGQYEPFAGLCLVDTFQLAEPQQAKLFTTDNTERVNQQKKAPNFRRHRQSPLQRWTNQ